MLLYRRQAGGSAAAGRDVGRAPVGGSATAGCASGPSRPGRWRRSVGPDGIDPLFRPPIDQGPSAATLRHPTGGPGSADRGTPVASHHRRARRPGARYVHPCPVQDFRIRSGLGSAAVARAAPPSFAQGQSVLPARAMAGVDRLARARARRPDQRADRCLAPRALCRCHRILRDARCRRPRGHVRRALRNRGTMAPRSGDAPRPGPFQPVDQRGNGPPDRRFRHASGVHDGTRPAVLRAAGRGTGLPEGRRHIRLQNKVRFRAIAHHGAARCRRRKTRARASARTKALRRRDRAVAGHLQRRLGPELGIRTVHRRRIPRARQESALSCRSGADSDRRGRRRARRVHRRHPQYQRGDPRARWPALAARLGEAPVATQGAPSHHRPRAADGRATQISAHAPWSRARVPRDRRRADEDAGSWASRTSSSPGFSRTTPGCAASSSRSGDMPTSAIASTSGNSMEAETYSHCTGEH